MINKSYKFHFIIILLIAFTLMGVGAVYDYEITEYLYNPDNLFAVSFTAFGSFPLYMFVPFLAVTMAKKNAPLPILVFSFGTLFLSFVLPIYVGIEVMLDHGQMSRLDPYLSGVFAGVLASLVVLFLRALPKRQRRNISSLCAFSLMFLIGESALIYGLKYVFGRDRYADIVTLSSEFSYTPWYNPDFFSAGTSFPSGHVGAAMGILVILLFPFIFDFFKGSQTVMFIIAYTYVGLMSVARLMMGRHFLSDTMASVIILTLLFMLLSPLYEKLYMPKIAKKKLIEDNL